MAISLADGAIMQRLHDIWVMAGGDLKALAILERAATRRDHAGNLVEPSTEDMVAKADDATALWRLHEIGAISRALACRSRAIDGDMLSQGIEDNRSVADALILMRAVIDEMWTQLVPHEGDKTCPECGTIFRSFTRKFCGGSCASRNAVRASMASRAARVRRSA